jgi:hypothetical protein
MELQPGELLGWVRAFVFTQLVEVPLYVAALSFTRLCVKKPLWQKLGVAFLCSLVTHPVVWFVFPRIMDAYEDYVLMVIEAETFAVVIEALILRRFGLRWALLVAFVTNMSSMSLGFLIRYLWHWL